MARASASLKSVALTVALIGLMGCERREGGSTVMQPKDALPSEGAIAAVPLGDLAGTAALRPVIDNPYRGQPEAVQDGRTLYVRMNCANCHGYDGKGGMGPDLTDTYWRYGGTPVQIYKSIYEGRPQGMPAWGRALPPQDIWKLVAYIQSFGGAFPPDFYQAGIQGNKLPGQNNRSKQPGQAGGARSGGQSPEGGSNTGPGTQR